MTQKNAKVKNSDKNQQMLIIGGIVALVVVVFGVVLYLAAPKSRTLDYSDVYAERTEDGAFVLGNPEAPVTIVAFEDFLCPHCQAYQSTVHRFLEEYVLTGKARFEFRMLPISQQSGFVFSLVECVAEVEDDPNAFWSAHDEMFRLTTSSGSSFDGSDFAIAVDVPYSSLLDCADEATQYQTDQALAGQYNQAITGTPAVVWRLNGGQIRLDVITRQPSYEEMATLVDTFGALQGN